MVMITLTFTALLLPCVYTATVSRTQREINSKPNIELGLNLIPPDTGGPQNEPKEIYRCKDAPRLFDDSYGYDAPRIQLIEDPKNVGYKVSGPKIIYIDCTTTTRKPNTEKILRYHFEMSLTNYPKGYTTEWYPPVTYRSTPGRKYLPEGGPITPRPFQSIKTDGNVGDKIGSESLTSFGIGSLNRFGTSSTKKQPDFVTKRPTEFSPSSFSSRLTTPAPFSFGASKAYEITTRRSFFDTTVKSKLSTSGAGYLPPE